MVKCAQCDSDVALVQNITPDLITKEFIDRVDHGKEVLVGDDDMKVCAQCMDELQGN